MGCSSCGTKTKSSINKSQSKTSITVTQECSYTIDLMVLWKEKLICIKENNLFSEIGFNKYKINFAMGTVQSAINTGNACIFQKQLDKINDIILSLINTGKC